MGKPKTWKILSPFKSDGGTVDLICPHCQADASVETNGRVPVIAVVGLGLVLDPPGFPVPDDYLPTTIQCRQCRRIYSSEG
jgi:hypothetical protein